MISRARVRLAAVAVAAGFLVGGSSVASPQEAVAWDRTGCRSGEIVDRGYDVYVNTSSVNTTYANSIAAGAGDWNMAKTPVRFSRGTTTVGGGTIPMYAGSYAWNAYAITTWTCSSGEYRDRSIKFNTRTMAKFAEWQRRFVVVHELGHAIGLNHTNYSKPCGVSVMAPDAVTGTRGCSSRVPPWSDDKNGANAIY